MTTYTLHIFTENDIIRLGTYSNWHAATYATMIIYNGGGSFLALGLCTDPDKGTYPDSVYKTIMTRDGVTRRNLTVSGFYEAINKSFRGVVDISDVTPVSLDL